MSFSNPIVGGETLIRKSIQSPNYIPDTAGWIVSRDGVIEANNAKIRGTLNVAAGVVTINNFGIQILGPNDRFTIDVTGGIRGTKVPNNGSYITFTADAIFIHDTDPSPVNGLASDSTVLQMLNVVDGTTEWKNFTIFGPEWDSQPGQAEITMWSRSSGGTVDPIIDFKTPRIRFDDDVQIRQQDGDPLFFQYVGNAVRGTDILIPTTAPGVVLFTFTGMTWRANTAYLVRVTAKYQGTSGTGQTPLLVLRTGTTTAGAVLVDNGRVDYVSASTNLKIWEARFIVGASDLARDICVTAQQSVTNTVTQQGTGANPALLEVFEIGGANRYSGFVTIT